MSFLLNLFLVIAIIIHLLHYHLVFESTALGIIYLPYLVAIDLPKRLSLYLLVYLTLALQQFPDSFIELASHDTINHLLLLNANVRCLINFR